jgi:hypothetical protein
MSVGGGPVQWKMDEKLVQREATFQEHEIRPNSRSDLCPWSALFCRDSRPCDDALGKICTRRQSRFHGPNGEELNEIGSFQELSILRSKNQSTGDCERRAARRTIRILEKAKNFWTR